MDKNVNVENQLESLPKKVFCFFGPHITEEDAQFAIDGAKAQGCDILFVEGRDFPLTNKDVNKKIDGFQTKGFNSENFKKLSGFAQRMRKENKNNLEIIGVEDLKIAMEYVEKYLPSATSKGGDRFDFEKKLIAMSFEDAKQSFIKKREEADNLYKCREEATIKNIKAYMKNNSDKKIALFFGIAHANNFERLFQENEIDCNLKCNEELISKEDAQKVAYRESELKTEREIEELLFEEVCILFYEDYVGKKLSYKEYGETMKGKNLGEINNKIKSFSQQKMEEYTTVEKVWQNLQELYVAQ